MGIERSTGEFKCPTCYQKYMVPTATVGGIQGHMQKHGQSVDRRWVRRRLKEVPALSGDDKEK